MRLRRAELTFWAFILALAYLPLPFGFLAWFALARPLAIIFNLKGKSAFTAAYFFAFMSNLFQLYWVAVVTPPGMVAAIVVLSLYPAVVLLAANRLYRIKKILGLIGIPILWVGMEYFRSLSQFAFPWTDLGYSQGYYLTIIQIVSVTGVYGLSLALMIMNVCTWQLFSSDNRLETRVSSAIGFIGILVAVFLYGWVVFPPLEEPGTFKVALLQGNVSLKEKWGRDTRDNNFRLYDSLATEAADDSVDLIIWPETAAPAYPRVEMKYQFLLREAVLKTKVPHLIGGLDVEYVDRSERSYNSAFQFSPDGRIEQYYHKIKLVPFSEHTPYQDYFPYLTRDFLGKYLSAIRTRKVQWWSDFYPGDSITIFHVGEVDYAVAICFEVAFPEFTREALHAGADFIVTITNDTWFGRSPGPYQHMRLAVFRAVENRVWLARCANSGISAVIDPYGRETAYGGLYERKVLIGAVKPKDEFSTFTSVGPIVGTFCWLLTLAVLSILSVWWIWKKTR